MAKENFYISTSIPYVNAAPHLGHALEFVQADVIARHHRLKGDDVFFLSGTDDNALKNVQAAEKAGQEVSAYVAENAKHFEALIKALDISNDDFIKTSSDPRHAKGAQKLWSACKKEDIYKKKYKGFYCIGCEEFKTEKDLVNGECPEHPGRKLEEVEEENYFFKLSNYGETLSKLIESDTIRIIPEGRKNETLAFIKNGLEDFSISRSTERAKEWGVPVPGDSSQMMYVWFDALSNYINALGYADESENYKKYWAGDGKRVHAIGKGINRFHTIYWPAMLLSADVPLPTAVFIHGYITIDGQKMSKTIGNVIDPNDLIKEYGTDATRYFLLRGISTFEDSDITLSRLKEVYNGELANGIGNLVSRVMKMASTHLEGPISYDAKVVANTYNSAFENYNLKTAIDEVWGFVANLDRNIQEKEPFKVIKNNKEEGIKLIEDLVMSLKNIADLLEPFMPKTSEIILDHISSNKMPEKPLFMRKD